MTDSQIDAALKLPHLATLISNTTMGTKEFLVEMRTFGESSRRPSLLMNLLTRKLFIPISDQSLKRPNSSTDSYVQYITYGTIYPIQLLNGEVLLICNVETLGNMQANMSEDKATKLIQKWFYGKDLPMPVAGGDTANPNASSQVGKYYTSSGPMFKADIDLTDFASKTAGVLVTADDMAQGTRNLLDFGLLRGCGCWHNTVKREKLLKI